MTVFEECKIALSKDFLLLKEKEKEKEDLFKKFYQYLFKFGNAGWETSKVKNIDFYWLVRETDNNRINPNVYVIADVEDIPIFKTNLLLLLENIDDVSASSTKVFIFNEQYLAQIRSAEPSLSICKLL